MTSERLASRLKTLGDPVRLRIVALCRAGEISVGELTEVLGVSQPRVSQHLKLLCDAGLLNRFRDGKNVFYRLPDAPDPLLRRLINLVPSNDRQLDDDLARLMSLRGRAIESGSAVHDGPRDIARALIEQTVVTPIGDLLDIGCGRGRWLKLLASRANRVVGVDIDPDARSRARAEVMLAGLPNCSLRQGDMHRLQLSDASFDTVILDDVLESATKPQAVLVEAKRVLRPGGRLWILSRGAGNSSDLPKRLARWCREAGLRMALPKHIAGRDNHWMFVTATLESASEVAA